MHDDRKPVHFAFKRLNEVTNLSEAVELDLYFAVSGRAGREAVKHDVVCVVLRVLEVSLKVMAVALRAGCKTREQGVGWLSMQ